MLAIQMLPTGWKMGLLTHHSLPWHLVATNVPTVYLYRSQMRYLWHMNYECILLVYLRREAINIRGGRPWSLYAGTNLSSSVVWLYHKYWYHEYIHCIQFVREPLTQNKCIKFIKFIRNIVVLTSRAKFCFNFTIYQRQTEGTNPTLCVDQTNT